ncbi:hypothetical protein ENBRE01_0574 [Enteropsectra breve]|nr:hypothetical protein ENBRE01_0574 [Enteropsectra breve]
MDLITLGQKIKQDKLTWLPEYLEELDALEALIKLPNPPVKQMKPLIAFIVRYCYVEPERSIGALVGALSAIKDSKIRKSILGGLILVRQKRLIDSRVLIKNILLYGSDLKFYHKGVTEFLDFSCYDILVEWYGKGTEKQRCFCYYFLLVLFSRLPKVKIQSNATDEDDKENNDNQEVTDKISESKTEYPSNVDTKELERLICESLFSSEKISKICMLYFLNRTDVSFDISRIENGAEYGKRIYKEINETLFDRDEKIMKLKIYVLFKNHFGIKKSITKMVLKMIDLDKPDLRELLDCLVASVSPDEAVSVSKTISDEFLSRNKEDDVVCYGMNLMREIYYKVAGIEKVKAIDFENLEELSSIDMEEIEGSEQSEAVDEMESLNEVESLEEVDSGYEEMESLIEMESLEEEEISVEMEAVEEINSKDGSESESKEENSLKGGLKKAILELIEPYKGNRSKSICFAYKALLKALIKNEAIDKPTSFVKRSSTKEEREKIRTKNKEERKREIKKERYEAKQKKRGARKQNKKNKLLMSTKKKSKK